MKRKLVTSSVAAAALVAGVVGATAATAAPTSSAKLSTQDSTYLKNNYQVDLAEITLGHYIQKTLAPGSIAVALADRTVADHEKAAALVRAIAKKDGLALPTKPNATQQAAAANVKAAVHTSYRYFVAQVAGHKTSQAQTFTELKKGTDKVIVAYAKGYLPVVGMHLNMSKVDVKRAVR